MHIFTHGEQGLYKHWVVGMGFQDDSWLLASPGVLRMLHLHEEELQGLAAHVHIRRDEV